LEEETMIFGKYMNRYYLRYAIPLLFGILSLIVVDALQLKVPELYRMVLDGVNDGYVTVGDQLVEFNLNFLLDRICGPLIVIIISLVIGRFLWRICFFGSAIRVETDLRGRMFNHCKDLSQPYYQTN
jgi:ATP-binding cassette subfamily B protein